MSFQIHLALFQRIVWFQSVLLQNILLKKILLGCLGEFPIPLEPKHNKSFEKNAFFGNCLIFQLSDNIVRALKIENLILKCCNNKGIRKASLDVFVSIFPLQWTSKGEYVVYWTNSKQVVGKQMIGN